MLVAMQQDIRPNTCFGSKLTRQFCLSRSLRVYGQLMFMRIPFLTQPSNCPFSATLGTTFDTPTNSTPPSICERSGNEALARTLNRTRSVVQFSHVSHQPLVPPPLTRCLFFLFSSVPVLAGVHRILKTKHSSWFWFWRFPMAQPFQGMGLSQLATSSSDQPSLSSTPRLSMPSVSPWLNLFREWGCHSLRPLQAINRLFPAHRASPCPPPSLCVRHYRCSPPNTSHYPESYHPPYRLWVMIEP